MRQKGSIHEDIFSYQPRIFKQFEDLIYGQVLELAFVIDGD